MTEQSKTDFHKVREILKDLPVAKVANDVVKSVMKGDVTILAAPTGSGKSMMMPAELAEATQEQVIVLVPRRFLATDAATNVAQMADSEVGTDVGYAIGRMAGESSKKTEDSKVIFMTYGYAISSGIIDTAKNIVLDEVHEADEHMSLARSILFDRKAVEPDLHLLEMSATINAEKQAKHWSDVAKTDIHSVEGQRLVCEERHQKPSKDEKHSIPQTAIDLLTKEHRNGIAIFRSGVKEVQDTAHEIEEMLRAKGIRNVEVVQIYSDTLPNEKRRARAEPKPGGRKIIVGTNVIESGVNLPWVDSAISDGMGKIPYERSDTGADALVPEHLPQWRLVQQRGRVNRFPDKTGFASGIFILHSKIDMDKRPQNASPELERCSLSSFAFRAAALGYKPTEMHVDADIPKRRWEETQAQLKRLGLVNDDWTLTKDGEYISHLPLSPETGVMLVEAHRLDIAAARSGDVATRKRPKLLPDAIILAALTELGGIRKRYSRGHGMDGSSDIHGSSDLMDGMKAYLKLAKTDAAKTVARYSTVAAEPGEEETQFNKARHQLELDCDKYNVDIVKFSKAMHLVGEVTERHVRQKRDSRSVVNEEHEFDQQRYDALKQVALSGGINRVFQLNSDGVTYRDLLRDFQGNRNDKGDPFNDYRLNPTSVVANSQTVSRTPIVVGKLREIMDKQTNKITPMLDQVTSIPAEVLIKWAAEHPTDILSEVYAGDKELAARYSGKAAFTVPLRKHDIETAEHIQTLKDKQEQHDLLGDQPKKDWGKKIKKERREPPSSNER